MLVDMAGSEGESKGNAPLLFVGVQSGAVRALEALDRSAVVLVAEGAQAPDHERVTAAGTIDLHGAFEPILGTARELLGGRPPAAVVALAERSVSVAARLREAFGLPGNSPTAALRCADKVEMKRAMGRAGVAVAPWREVGSGTRADELVEALGLPLVLKPRRDSGGRGQSKLESAAAVAECLEEVARTDTFDTAYGWLAEGWVEGVEMSIESFLADGATLLENPTEYYVLRHANILPAVLDARTWSEVRDLNQRALAAAGVTRGITHLELFRTARGPVFGELAARPPGGRLMTLLRRAWGFDPWKALLRLELGEELTLPRTPKRTAGVWVLYPGAGQVKRIDGLEAARATPHVRRIALKVGPGDSIGDRVASGVDVGSIHAEGPDRDRVAEALRTAHARLVIHTEPRGELPEPRGESPRAKGDSPEPEGESPKSKGESPEPRGESTRSP